MVKNLIFGHLIMNSFNLTVNTKGLMILLIAVQITMYNFFLYVDIITNTTWGDFSFTVRHPVYWHKPINDTCKHA